MKSLSRRTFLLEAIVIPSLAAKFVETSSIRLPSAKAVANVAAEIGCLYPSASLLSSLAASRSNTAHFVLPEQREKRLRGDPLTVVEFARVFPEARDSRENGLLQPEYRETLLKEMVVFLKQHYRYPAVNMEAAANPSFWYPFLSDPIVFCRLSIRNMSHAQSQ